MKVPHSSPQLNPLRHIEDGSETRFEGYSLHEDIRGGGEGGGLFQAARRHKAGGNKLVARYPMFGGGKAGFRLEGFEGERGLCIVPPLKPASIKSTTVSPPSSFNKRAPWSTKKKKKTLTVVPSLLWGCCTHPSEESLQLEAEYVLLQRDQVERVVPHVHLAEHPFLLQHLPYSCHAMSSHIMSCNVMSTVRKRAKLVRIVPRHVTDGSQTSKVLAG